MILTSNSEESIGTLKFVCKAYFVMKFVCMCSRFVGVGAGYTETQMHFVRIE